MGDLTYNWFIFNMNVDCRKCGTKIVLQSTQDKIVCTSCGETSKSNWEEVCNIADIKDQRSGKGSNKRVSGPMNIAVYTEPIDVINCNHCKKEIDLKYDPVDENNCDCPSCKKKLVFEKLNSYTDYLFYRYVNPKPLGENTTIAVRCVACGAPLETDPTKDKYSCTFCGVENILPASLKQKRVLDNIFLGVRKKVADPKNILVWNNFDEILDCLRANNATAFTKGDLDKLVIKFPDEQEMYQLITATLGHKFLTETFEKLWKDSRTKEILNNVGKKLKYSDAEITHQYMRFDDDYMQKYKEEKAKKENESFWNKLNRFFK